MLRGRGCGGGVWVKRGDDRMLTPVAVNITASRKYGVDSNIKKHTVEMLQEPRAF
jgi:hypothetical protein